MTSKENSPLTELRDKISDLDEQLLSLLAKRRDLVLDIAEVKIRHGMQLRDKQREAELIEHLIRLGEENQLESHYIVDIFKRIVEYSLEVQELFLQDKSDQK